MAQECPRIEPEKRYVATTFPEYVWVYLEQESENTGSTMSDLVSRIVADYVRAEKGNCG